MPINDFNDDTFVAFLDISGFKDLMKNNKGLEALKILYQAGYDVLQSTDGVEGFFVSDSGILFARNGSTSEKLSKLLLAIKAINKKMLRKEYMLTTSIAYGNFNYQGKLEFDGITKNPIYGYAYVKAFLDNEVGTPRLQPGQCRLVLDGIPTNLDFSGEEFKLLKQRENNSTHKYYYWNLDNIDQIQSFEKNYTNSYKLKYAGMLIALNRQQNL